MRMGLVQPLQNQAIDLGDLSRLLQQRFAAASPVFLRHMGAVFGQTGLEDIEAADGAAQQPASAFPSQLAPLDGLLETAECFEICR